jgi:hypothetical protein
MDAKFQRMTLSSAHTVAKELKLTRAGNAAKD